MCSDILVYHRRVLLCYDHQLLMIFGSSIAVKSLYTGFMYKWTPASLSLVYSYNHTTVYAMLGKLLMYIVLVYVNNIYVMFVMQVHQWCSRDYRQVYGVDYTHIFDWVFTVNTNPMSLLPLKYIGRWSHSTHPCSTVLCVLGPVVLVPCGSVLLICCCTNTAKTNSLYIHCMWEIKRFIFC